MTTLIVHPKLEIQKQKALELITKLLQLPKEYSDMFEIHHPDLHIIDGTTVSSIGIEDIKKFLHTLQFQPYQAQKQIGVILFSDALTTEAQNSLLKTLEEPGMQTEYILTVSHEKKLLPTIISRTNILHIEEELNSLSFTESINLNEFLNLDITEKFKEIEKIVDKDKTEKDIVKNFLLQLSHYYREKLIYYIRKNDKKNAREVSRKLKEISKTIYYISKNTNKKLTLENLILQLEPHII